MRIVRGLVPFAVAVLVVAAAALGASSVPAQPLGVQAASVTQVGQDLVWQVELVHSFSPAGLRRDGRSLCLLIERASSGSAVGQVCLAGPRPGSPSPSVLYSPITRSGRGRRGGDRRDRDADERPRADGELPPVEHRASVSPAPLAGAHHGSRARRCTPAARGTSMCSELFPATPRWSCCTFHAWSAVSHPAPIGCSRVRARSARSR